MDVPSFPTSADIEKHTKSFWLSFIRQWDVLYEALTVGIDSDRDKVLQLMSYFAGPLSHYLDFEITVGEVNRIFFEKTTSLVEIYVSPKMIRANVPIMESLVAAAPKLKNLHIIKYRSYNIKDPNIYTVEYQDVTYSYYDFGCQYFNGIDENKKPLINIVIYVKKAAAESLLTQKEVTFILADKTEKKMVKWMPTKTNVIDVLLINIIGEYNYIHRTGYIEFLPEGDPLIAPGSIFTELSDLRNVYVIFDKTADTQTCQICARRDYQISLSRCSRCKKTKYCCVECQLIDYSVHKQMCTNLHLA
jgi:hypothetical protein